MIQDLIKVQGDILRIPDLSIKQKNKIKRVREELHDLSLQKEDEKIKLELIDIMNRLS